VVVSNKLTVDFFSALQNQKLFNELYVAYLNGKMDKDPAEFWYKGEIGFFDFYIVSQKLAAT
jgi:hypothetical protein